MPSGADKIKAILRGAAIGFVAVVILLLVPVFGVRKGLEDLVANWQELALYASCLLTGTLAGARLALNRGSIYEDDDAPSSNPAIGNYGDSRPEPELINFEDAVEQSLAGEPKKRRLGPFVYYLHHDRERTLALLASLYVILYVNCAVLCQKMHLGIIVAGAGDTIMRSLGVGVTVVGLYVGLKGVFRTGRQKAADALVGKREMEDSILLKELEAAKQSAECPTEPATQESSLPTKMLDSEGSAVPSQEKIQPEPHLNSPFRMESSRLVYSSMVSHIPPTRFRFVTRNPICLGALLVFSGLPLVFHAWFPLVAIPGIFIVMSWMFSGDRENPESLVVQGQQ